MEPQVNLILFGDGAVGKSCLLLSYTTRIWNETYVPTVVDNYEATIQAGNSRINLKITDTAGSEGFREIFYRRLNLDVILLCYSCIRRSSFRNLEYWITDLNTLDKPAPLYLVATKKDLYDTENVDHVSLREGKRKAKRIHSIGFRETSSLLYCQSNGEEGDVVKVINEAIIYSLQRKNIFGTPTSCFLC